MSTGRFGDNGKVGQPGGRSKHKPWKEALMRVLKIPQGGGGGPCPAMDELAIAIVAAAKGGDVAAMKEIADRLEGKVPQTQILQGDEDGGALRVQAITRTIVDTMSVITGESIDLGIGHTDRKGLPPVS